MSRLLIFLLLTLLITGCGSSEPEFPEQTGWQAAFDSKTKTVYAVDSAVSLPTSHPENPKSQLTAAWYCESCGKWYPVPPLEQINRSKGAANCPKDGKPLSADGPRPDKSLSIGKGEAN